MAAEASGNDLVQVVSLLAAGVVAVPIFKRLGLGSVLGDLVAGVVIGPFALRLFTDSQAILHVAELGVVMFLFVIGLEMQPSRLWSLRREIFGLGAAQVFVSGALLTIAGTLAGFPPAVAFVAGMGFVLSSTAIVMQVLNERGDNATPAGQRIMSILLLEDLAIVPLLAIVAFLAPGSAESEPQSRWAEIAIALAALAALIAAGRWLLNPMFRLLAAAEAREVMTAAALLVVLGAALAMQIGGLSMAMGAFLAGVLLSESTFRHQLEADVEPFRGILLGLFFIGVGMSLDLSVIATDWPRILALVAGFMVLQFGATYTVARLTGADHGEALMRSSLLAQGGEFAFVLYAGAAAVGLMDGKTQAVMTATVILSMALTPLLAIAIRRLQPKPQESMEGVDVAENLTGRVLVVGFGRFGQISSQPLLLRGVDVSIIDNDIEMIKVAATFGFKVYYGDGTRLDILHAAGAGRAEAVLICVDKGEAAVMIAQHMKSEFPLVPVLARAFDRRFSMELVRAGVDYQLRETFESALAFGEEALVKLGIDAELAADTIVEVRRRDQARLDMQLAGGVDSGSGYLKGNVPMPAPLSQPRQAGRAINEETATAMADRPGS
jgi:glutathione-regulated potassium-efflux system protein KefB